MNRLIPVLIAIFLLFSGSIYAEDNDKNFMDIFIQITLEKDLEIRLEKYESLMTEGDSYARFVVLNHVAKTAFDAENYEKAAIYAIELLESAPQYKDDWNYGNAIHDGHLVLGRIAFLNGDIEKAKNELLLAGKTPGSPQLNSFGPNMSLANDLINAGEKNTVIEYLKECKRFWGKEDGRIDSWLAAIKGGGKPYFGMNL